MTVGYEKLGGHEIEGTVNKDITNDEITCEAHEQIVKALKPNVYGIWRASVRSEKVRER